MSATGTVRLHRVLKAPPERVYKAFLNPEAMAKWLHPDLFKVFEAKAREMGFSHAAVGAMVRSSYHADQQAHAAGVSIGA